MLQVTCKLLASDKIKYLVDTILKLNFLKTMFLELLRSSWLRITKYTNGKYEIFYQNVRGKEK